MVDPQPLHFQGIDHIVLVVPDVDAILGFYRDQLGLAVEDLEEFRRGERPFFSVRVSDSTLIDVLPGDRTGENVNHFALVVDTDIDALARSGQLAVEAGPRDLSGARGTGRGIYVRDPAGNLVELRSYG